MADLHTFLTARLYEDEAAVARGEAEGFSGDSPWTLPRDRREVEAKRKILALHVIHSEPEILNIRHQVGPAWNDVRFERKETGRLSWWCVICDDDRDYGHIGGPEEGCPTLRALAAVYSDDPGYRQEWAS